MVISITIGDNTDINGHMSEVYFLYLCLNGVEVRSLKEVGNRQYILKLRPLLVTLNSL